MVVPRSTRLRRRGLLGIPALVVAASTVVARPAHAAPAAPAPESIDAHIECVADLFKVS